MTTAAAAPDRVGIHPMEVPLNGHAQARGNG
jgi:hypothetical protein